MTNIHTEQNNSIETVQAGSGVTRVGLIGLGNIGNAFAKEQMKLQRSWRHMFYKFIIKL